MGLKDEILVANSGCKKSEVSPVLFDWQTQGIEPRKSVSHISPVQLYVSYFFYFLIELFK